MRQQLRFLKRLLHLVRYVWSVRHVLRDKQSTESMILKVSHQLEKGLLHGNPRANWGYDKAELLLDLLLKRQREAGKNDFAVRTGVGVLKEYLKRKKELTPDEERLPKLLEKAEGLDFDNCDKGGSLSLSREDIQKFSQQDAIEFIKSRHSIRHFDERPVNPEDIKKAVELANYCPSACNRQPYKVHVLSKELRDKYVKDGNSFNAHQSLIITTDPSSFNGSEMFDWIVCGSIFTGFLTLALHAYGIGSCIVHKDNLQQGDSKAIKKALNISQKEHILIEVVCGYYDERSTVPCSNRKIQKELLG